MLDDEENKEEGADAVSTPSVYTPLDADLQRLITVLAVLDLDPEYSPSPLFDECDGPSVVMRITNETFGTLALIARALGADQPIHYDIRLTVWHACEDPGDVHCDLQWRAPVTPKTLAEAIERAVEERRQQSFG
jgi:hypothetical protein